MFFVFDYIKKLDRKPPHLWCGCFLSIQTSRIFDSWRHSRTYVLDETSALSNHAF